METRSPGRAGRRSRWPHHRATYVGTPTVAIEQRTSRGGRKSTVATMTEVYHFLRLLFVKLGTQYCPACDVPIREQTPAAIRAHIMKAARNRKATLLAPLVVARKGYYTDLAQWAARKGYTTLRVDGEYLPTDNWPRLARHQEHDIDLPVGTLKVTAGNEDELDALIAAALEHGHRPRHPARDPCPARIPAAGGAVLSQP